jgi:hypothetical protein
VDEGLQVGLKRRSFFPNDPSELYDNACELATLVEFAEKQAPRDATRPKDLPQRCAAAALDALAQAIARGFNDPRRLLLEPRLGPIRTHPRLEALLRKLPAFDSTRLQIHRGRLTEQDGFDRKFTQTRCRTYNVRLDAGKKYQLDLLSIDFDAFLRVESESGQEQASNDNGGEDLNARLVFTPAESGMYHVVVTSSRAGQTGYFVLGIEEKGTE